MTRLSLIQRNLKRERLVKKYSKKRIALKKIIKNKKTSHEVRIDAINKFKIPLNDALILMSQAVNSKEKLAGKNHIEVYIMILYVLIRIFVNSIGL